MLCQLCQVCAQFQRRQYVSTARREPVVYYYTPVDPTYSTTRNEVVPDPEFAANKNCQKWALEMFGDGQVINAWITGLDAD